MCRASIPALSSAEIAVALIQWLVYRLDNEHTRELSGIMLAYVFFPIGALQYHTVSDSLNVSSGRCHKSFRLGDNLHLYFLKAATGHVGSSSLLYIFPSSIVSSGEASALKLIYMKILIMI